MGALLSTAHVTDTKTTIAGNTNETDHADWQTKTASDDLCFPNSTPGIRFESSSAEMIRTRCWHPGERMEGSVLVRKDMFEGTSQPVEIRIVLRRVIKFPAALMKPRDVFTPISELGPFQSEQCSVADQVIYSAHGPKVAAWKGAPRIGTELTEFRYSLLLPPSRDKSDKIVASLPGLVDYDLLIMVSQQTDGSNARAVAAIKDLQMAPRTENSIPLPPEPLSVSANCWPVMPSSWSRGEKAARIEAYPGAPFERHARLAFDIYIPNQDLAAGYTYPVVVLIIAGGPKHEPLEKVDWGYLMPDLPSPGQPPEEFGLALETCLEYEAPNEPALLHRVLLPEFKVAGVWCSGHVQSTAARDWAGRPCEGLGWQKPSFDRGSTRWTRYAYLVGRVTVPEGYPPSCQLTTSVGTIIRLRHFVSVPHYLKRGHADVGIISGFLNPNRIVITNSGHVLHQAEAPPDYVH